MATLTPDPPTNDKPLVYISVLNWNGADNTIRCLESLQHLNYPNYRILVVDNASMDDSVMRIQAAFPYIEIIRSSENLGYAGGNRLALERAIRDGAELFWILNNDTIVESDALKMLVDAYEHNGIALYGSLTLHQFGQDQGWRVERDFYGYKKPLEGIVDFRTPLIAHRQELESLTAISDRVITVANLNGNSLLIPLSLVANHGYMDEAFFMYAEEWEYCFRLARKGIPSRLVLSSIVYHKSQGSFRHDQVLSAVMRYYQVRNILLVTKLYAGNSDYHDFIKKYLRRVYIQIKKWLCDLLVTRRPKPLPLEVKYYLIGIADGLLGRMGKRYSPEDFLSLSREASGSERTW